MTKARSILNEELLPLSKAAKRLPRVRGSKPPHPNTLMRWVTSGLQAKSGQRIKLESIKVGGTRCTSIEAMERFFSRLDDVVVLTASSITQKQLESQTREVNAILRERGIIVDDDG